MLNSLYTSPLQWLVSIIIGVNLCYISCINWLRKSLVSWFLLEADVRSVGSDCQGTLSAFLDFFLSFIVGFGSLSLLPLLPWLSDHFSSQKVPSPLVTIPLLIYESVLYGSSKVFNVLDSGSVYTCRYCDGEVKSPIMFVFHSVVLCRHGWSLLLHSHPAGFTHWLRPLLERILGGEDGGRQFSLLVCRYGDSVPMRPNIWMETWITIQEELFNLTVMDLNNT